MSPFFLALSLALSAGGALAQARDCSYGPDTCIQGYVWREAFPGDAVCVTPATREQAAADNRAAAQRRACR